MFGDPVGAIGHQTAGLNPKAGLIDRWQLMLGAKRNEPIPMEDGSQVWRDKQPRI